MKVTAQLHRVGLFNITSVLVRNPSHPFVTCLFFAVSGCWALAEFPRWRMAFYASTLLVPNVGFMVDKMSLAKICLRVLRFLPVSIIPPMLSTHTAFITRNINNLNN